MVQLFVFALHSLTVSSLLFLCLPDLFFVVLLLMTFPPLLTFPFFFVFVLFCFLLAQYGLGICQVGCFWAVRGAPLSHCGVAERRGVGPALVVADASQGHGHVFAPSLPRYRRWDCVSVMSL